MIQIWEYDENGFFTESVFVKEVKENMTETPIEVGYYKAKWNGTEWVEGATQEEIIAFQEANKVIPTTDDILRAKLIKDNANIQLQLAQQQNLNADILLKIAKLGGATNV